MRASVAVVPVFMLAAALAAAGCDWREFDKLKPNTPVAAIASPSGSDSDFGAVLLPLDPPSDGSAAGRFVTTSVHKTGVTVVTFDPAGRPTGTDVSNDAIVELQGGPVTAIAPIPGGKEVLLGAPTPSLGNVVVMGLTFPYPARSLSGTQPEGQYGVGLAAGHLGGGADPEFVVLSSSALHVFVDGRTDMDREHPSGGASDPCPIEFSSNLPEDARLNRAVMVEKLLASGTQIAVGTPSTSGVGHVSLFEFDAAAGTFTCAAVLTGTEPHFGRAMTLVDIDGDGTRDRLLVGAPPSRAYLYTLPLSTGATPAAMAMDTMTDGTFGASVAAFDIDGKPGDEMFIGNPDGTAGGTTTAGRVSVYTGASMTLLPATAAFPNPLSQHEPGAGDGYGLSVGGVPFCPGGGADGGAATCTKLPLVGSRSRVYTYFTLRKPDPRVK